MKFTPLDLPEVLLVEPKVFSDHRGYSLMAWQEPEYAAAGIGERFVQDSMSRSGRGVLRGLHLQWPRVQGKLVAVLEGCVLDVAVDVRRGSPTFGSWVAEELSAENHRQLWVPPGFAHGFAVISDHALMYYKLTGLYAPTDELTIAWNDPDIGIRWPIATPLMAARDAAAPLLRDVPADRLPTFALAE